MLRRVQASNVTVLQQYYRRAYAAIRSASPDALVGVVPRSGDSDDAWKCFMAGPAYSNVVLATTRCLWSLEPAACVLTGHKSAMHLWASHGRT